MMVKNIHKLFLLGFLIHAECAMEQDQINNDLPIEGRLLRHACKLNAQYELEIKNLHKQLDESSALVKEAIETIKLFQEKQSEQSKLQEQLIYYQLEDALIQRELQEKAVAEKVAGIIKKAEQS